MVLVAAEMMGAKAGLGYLISLLRVVINQALVAVERRFSRWCA